MRYVTIDKVKQGMVVARDIFAEDHVVLISHGSILSETYIEGLIQHGFAGVYIEDELTKDITMKSVIPEELRFAGMECIKRCDIDGCKEVAEEIVHRILEEGIGSLNLQTVYEYSDHTYSHSVSVAVLCCVMGIAIEYSNDQLQDLVYAGLLHDLGKLKIPNDILNKQTKLTNEEYALIKMHPIYSYDMIKNQSDISQEVKNAVLNHHENVDGSGYPAGLMAENLNEICNILHVVDVYDALTSRRPYKNPFCPYDACEYLMGGCGLMFDRQMVEVLTRHVPLFPKGTEIQLSNGDTGIILDNFGIHNLRPIVRLMDGSSMDLSERKNMHISIVVPKYDPMDISRKRLMGEHLQKPCICIVDDMEINIAIMEEVLQEQFETKVFRNGNEIYDYILAGQKPDMILMDVDMPQMNGMEAAKRIIEKTKNAIPIVFVSEICNRETVMACKQMKAAGYILRPFNDIYLMGEINRILNVWGDL